MVGDGTSMRIRRPDVKAMAAYLDLFHPKLKQKRVYRTHLDDQKDGKQAFTKKAFSLWTWTETTCA